jgi:hypothetical protein
MGGGEPITLPPIKKRDGTSKKILSVMEQLANVVKKKLYFQEYNKEYYAKNKARVRRPRSLGKVPRAKQYKQKAIADAPETYTGTQEEWRLLTTKQRYRVMNSVHIKAYALRWQAANKRRTLPYYKEQFIRRKVEYKRKSYSRIRTVQKFRASTPIVKARKRAYKALPANQQRERVRRKAHRTRLNSIEKDYVTEFLRRNPNIILKSHIITSSQMDNMILRLLDSKTPSIVDNLHGLTLREAFVDRKLYASVYVWLARDSGVTKRPGQSFAEAERFLLCDPRPTLINGDTGQRYRGNDDSFRDIGLVTIPLASFDTACACSAFETKLQEFFNSRRYGCEKLWKVCGSGRLYQKLRRCDIAALEKSGSTTPVFTCGISYVNHVRIQSLSSNNIVTSIRSGSEGQLSKIQHPAKWMATYFRDKEMFGDNPV